MTLLVEDGSIVSGAESYVDAATATTYHANNGNTAWAAATTPAMEAALRKAARYMDGKYRSRFLGFRVRPVGTVALPGQAMEWPRLYVPVFGAAPGISPGTAYANYLPANQIPQRLKDAQCELALRALASDLATDGDVSIKRKKLDVIEKEYAANMVPGQIAYPVVDQLLSDYLKPMGSQDVLRG